MKTLNVAPLLHLIVLLAAENGQSLTENQSPPRAHGIHPLKTNVQDSNKEYDVEVPAHGILRYIKDTETTEEFDADRALHSLPPGMVVKKSSMPGAGLGVFTDSDILARVMFGPYGGVKIYDRQKAHESGYSWWIRTEGKKPNHYIDAQDKAHSNWLRYINSAPSKEEQNLVAFQYKEAIYYKSFKVIPKGSELLTWYGTGYGRALGLVQDKQLPKTKAFKRKGTCQIEQTQKIQSKSVYKDRDTIVVDLPYSLSGEDELECKACDPFRFMCLVHGVKMCLPIVKWCDGEQHCDENTDEADCRHNKQRIEHT